jgi:ABC-type polysaccharide/polyol phosphate transport system ATPase subunit
MPPVIQLDHVSKFYPLRHERARSFQESFVRLVRRKDPALSDVEPFWALKDVSLGIEPGEAIGFVGSNGAGKSSLLKLIARTNIPTSGRVIVNGKVSALLELGAGFHPDLSGRENVYLNGSLMGFSRAEMRERFDDIVDFSEVGHFIDVPVRNYSSGMYVRLAFAVAVHVMNGILLIDEVLAVGDEDFQRKCMDKMGEFKRSGKTIVLVSHALEAVRSLCDRVVWLENGQVLEDGDSVAVLDHYLRAANLKTKERMDQELARRKQKAIQAGPASEVGVYKRWGTGEARIDRVTLLNGRGEETTVFETGSAMTVRLWYSAKERLPRPVFGVGICRPDGVLLTGPNSLAAETPIPFIEGSGYVDYVIKTLPFLHGAYELSVSVYDETLAHPYDHHERLYTFRVEPGRVGERFGLITLSGRWVHRPSA